MSGCMIPWLYECFPNELYLLQKDCEKPLAESEQMELKNGKNVGLQTSDIAEEF